MYLSLFVFCLVVSTGASECLEGKTLFLNTRLNSLFGVVLCIVDWEGCKTTYLLSCSHEKKTNSVKHSAHTASA